MYAGILLATLRYPRRQSKEETRDKIRLKYTYLFHTNSERQASNPQAGQLCTSQSVPGTQNHIKKEHVALHGLASWNFAWIRVNYTIASINPIVWVTYSSRNCCHLRLAHKTIWNISRCACVCMGVCMCACICVCECIFIYTHMYTHTYIWNIYMLMMMVLSRLTPLGAGLRTAPSSSHVAQAQRNLDGRERYLVLCVLSGRKACICMQQIR